MRLKKSHHDAKYIGIVAKIPYCRIRRIITYTGGGFRVTFKPETECFKQDVFCQFPFLSLKCIHPLVKFKKFSYLKLIVARLKKMVIVLEIKFMIPLNIELLEIKFMIPLNIELYLKLSL